MKEAIRGSLVGYKRDTYLNRVQAGLAERGKGGTLSEDTGGITSLGLIDCGVGHSHLGPSPMVQKALQKIDAGELCRYPSRTHAALLKPAIMARFAPKGVAAHELFFGHGSFNLIERLVHKFIKPAVMLGVGPQFTEVPSEFIAAGGTYHPVPLEGDDLHLPFELLHAVFQGFPVAVMYLDNPNNPLGKFFPLGEVRRLARLCDRHNALLLVDEAYADFVDDRDSAIHLVGDFDNVIVTRSFSKALGLAAERIGYMFMSPRLADLYQEVDVPFEPGVIAATLAEATLADHDFIGQIRSRTRAVKATIVAALLEAGLEVLPSHPDVSILAVHAPHRDIVADLRRAGVVVQAGSSFWRTQPFWDDSYCRLRVVAEDTVDLLCGKLRALKR